ncbi:MAG: oligosaccharide repeat unit polymerase [Firmicutes bacterium]|nr:oligosaccharide repeat unit polymerase [Bacillota bacterium]
MLTIAVICVLFIISFLIFDRDLFAPPTVVSLVFLFGGVCCLYNEVRWGLAFSPKSTGLIAAGIIATMMGGLIGVFLSNYPKVDTFSFIHEKTEPQEVYISTVKTCIVIAFQLVTLYVLFRHISQLTGHNSWMLAVERYRELTGNLADVDDPSIRMPIITRNMVELSRLVGVIYAYIVGNNLIATRKILSLNWLPVIIYIVTTFMQGDRSNMIRLCVVALVTAYTVHKRKVGWQKSMETKKIIGTIVVSVALVCAVFVGFREIVGRETDMDPFYYLTFYAGSPIAVLNQVWDAPIVKPEVFGQRILFYFNESTTAFFGKPGRYNFYYPFFRSANGTFIGNAPTAFRPAFVEFGFWGFVFAMICFGAFFTLLYCRCRKKRGNSSIDIHLVIYAYISYVFIMYFYSTFFDFLSHVFIKYIIELLLIRWALVGWQFDKRYRLILRESN